MQGGCKTIYGTIARILENAWRIAGPLTLLNCDNVRHNGERFTTGWWSFSVNRQAGGNSMAGGRWSHSPPPLPPLPVRWKTPPARREARRCGRRYRQRQLVGDTMRYQDACDGAVDGLQPPCKIANSSAFKLVNLFGIQVASITVKRQLGLRDYFVNQRQSVLPRQQF